MEKIILNEVDLKIAHQLASIYYLMDTGRRVSAADKERLYAEITKNNDIHLKAREICNAMFRK